MKNIIFASHGSLAEGMMSAVTMIMGNSCKVSAYGLDHWETPQNIRQQIENQMKDSETEEIVILCDIKGGSVHNCLLELCRSPRVYLTTGMNLSLALELAVLSDDADLKEEIKEIIEISRDNIQCFTLETLEKMREEEGEDNLW